MANDVQPPLEPARAPDAPAAPRADHAHAGDATPARPDSVPAAETGNPAAGASADAAGDVSSGDAPSPSLELFADDADIERASRSLKAMSHPLRLKILCTLGDQEVSVQDIVEHVGTSQSNISQHLAILRDKGILAARKDANRVYYRVEDARTLRLIGMMREVFCHHIPS